MQERPDIKMAFFVKALIYILPVLSKPSQQQLPTVCFPGYTASANRHESSCTHADCKRDLK